MRRRAWLGPSVAAVCLLMGSARGVRASAIVDHQPLTPPTGGPGSDTEFRNMFGVPTWQLLADDFRVPADAAATQAVWWGFYDHDILPTFPETMRIRLYSPRADGLPGTIISEQPLKDPARAATGRQILVGGAPHEYRFEVDLTAPLSLLAGSSYWLEIVQVGDLNSAFRWEYSLADNTGQAFVNPRFTDWQNTGPGTGDLAFQLLTVPEPAAGRLLLLALGAAAFGVRRSVGHRHKEESDERCYR